MAQKIIGRISNGMVLGRLKSNRIGGVVISNGSLNGMVRTIKLIAKIEPKKITGKIIC